MTATILSDQDIQTAVQKKIVVIRLIPLALCGGIASFLGVVIFMFWKGPATPTAGGEALLLRLSQIHGLLAVLIYAAASVIPGRLGTQVAQAPSPTGETPSAADRALTEIQIANLVRLAMLEMVAFVGLVTCLLGAINGQLRVEPGYWANAASALIMMAYALLTLPSEARLLQEIRHRANPGVIS